MAAIKDNLISFAKRIRALRRVANPTLVEVVFETFNFSLSARYRLMRLVSLTDTLRNAAARLHRRANHVRPFPTTGTGFFPGLPVSAVVQASEQKDFARGIRLPDAGLSEIPELCSKKRFPPKRERNKLVQIDMTDEANPGPIPLIAVWVDGKNER